MKQLRNVDNGRIFAFTEALSELSNMVVVYGPGEQPDEPVSMGLQVDAADLDGKTKEMLREKDKIILNLEKQLSLVSDDNQKLLDEVADLQSKLNPDEPPETDKEPLDDLPSNDRMDVLVQSTLAMIAKDDPNDFTGAGVPRVERLEAWSGIAEVTAQERTEAFDKAKADLS